MLLGPTKTVSGRNSTSALAMGPKLETVSVKGLMSVGVTMVVASCAGGGAVVGLF